MRRPELLVISPTAGGHHGEYLRWIVEGLRGLGVGAISVAAHPALVDAEPEALADVDVRPLDGLDSLSAAGSLWATGRATGRLVQGAIEATGAADVLLPALDHAQLAFATAARLPRGARVSGILLRATLHEPPATLPGRLRQWRKTTLLRLAARHPNLGAVLALDPGAVAPLRRLGLDARWLPDPVVAPAPGRTPERVRSALGIEPGRAMWLLFGSLEERKGMFETLDALRRLPPDRARRVALVLAGRTYDAIRPRLADAIGAARATGAQVIFEERFVPDAELDDWVGAADLVLALYRGHVGSSGVVLRAAASGTPLLATEEGMVGREVRGHRLGQTVAVGDPAERAAALARAIEAPQFGFDADSAEDYASAHSVDEFARVLHSALFSDAPRP